MSNGIKQSLETLGNLGNTFINSFSAGMQISQSLEKSRREKRQAGLNLLKKTQTTLNDIYTTQGADAANQHMKTPDYQEAVKQLNNAGFNAELTPTGAFQKQVDYDTGIKIYMENNNLTEKQAKKRLKDNGISEGNLITFDMNYNNMSEINFQETQKSSSRTVDIKKKIQDLERTATNVTAKGYPKNINALVKIAYDNANLLNTPKEITEFKKLVNNIYPGYYEDVETTLNGGSNQLGSGLRFTAEGNPIDNAN
tara:strand:+ start:4844 stop:5605 length:762 start_codon:yes stop_codon:yes gene_type:complete